MTTLSIHSFHTIDIICDVIAVFVVKERQHIYSMTKLSCLNGMMKLKLKQKVT